MKLEAHVGSSETFAWVTFFRSDNAIIKGEFTLRSSGKHSIEIIGELDEMATVIARIYSVAVRRFTDVSKAKDLLLEIVTGYCDNDMDVEIDVKEI